MKKIYVAGSYSADNVMDVLTNMRKGMRLSTEAFLAGFAVFCPWLDHQFVWQLREGETLTIDNFYQYSITWLSVSDAILLVPGYENSYGTQKELERAKELEIPVFHSLQQLIDADKAGLVLVRAV